MEHRSRADQKIRQAHLNYPPLEWNLTNPNSSCAFFVSPEEVQYNNIYWQVQHTSNETYYFYGAYFDNRTQSGIGPAIRILGMSDRLLGQERNIFCQLRFPGEIKPFFSQVSQFTYLWDVDWDFADLKLQPYLITCELPEGRSHLVPRSVSLVEHQCDNASNNLLVVHNPLPPGQKRKDFAVCVKGLYFYHQSMYAVRVAEYVELLKILGADHVTIYRFQVHANISKVLDFYALTDGAVDVVDTTMPGPFANIPDFMERYLKAHPRKQYVQEVIHYNDCMYRQLDLFNYFVPIDIDEVIMPVSTDNWHDLVYKKAIPASQGQNVSAFVARNVFFADSEAPEHTDVIPWYMHMLQNVRRGRNFDPADYVGGLLHHKSFHDAQKVLSLYNHSPRECFDKKCKVHVFDPEDAFLQHYCIGRTRPECRNNNLTVDTTIWKFKNELIRNTNRVLRRAGILGADNT
ncbi:Hypothetical predicted protein [Cloeon dipterum]|uniref:Glycosyltransferase family 92 protein n=1 Tax=Cloeon dipterum TaxID=197152 RepID=A0A8S1E343_9INSE|nr:Hypothetical predicted protein [Cloeon dipterum]